MIGMSYWWDTRNEELRLESEQAGSACVVVSCVVGVSRRQPSSDSGVACFSSRPQVVELHGKNGAISRSFFVLLAPCEVLCFGGASVAGDHTPWWIKATR